MFYILFHNNSRAGTYCHYPSFDFISNPTDRTIAMKTYLAAQFARQNELKEYRDQLRELGIDVVSDWLDEEEDTKDDERQYRMYAEADEFDIERSDIFILFAYPALGGLDEVARGGCRYEMGYAKRAGKEIWVIGDSHLNIFCYNQDVVRWKTWEAALTELGTLRKQEEYAVGY